MTRTSRTIGLLTALLALNAGTARAVGLLGSPASMVRQHAIAVEEHYSFLRTPSDVARLVSEGGLVPVAANEDLLLAGVSFPYARPEVRDFLQRFARDYHDSTGVPATITSLVRPRELQPANAHKLSVHPAGMAVDFRVPATAAGREYLERALLGMESSGLLDVTRERTPAHYHVAVFAEPMLAYLARRNASDPLTPRSSAAAMPAPAADVAPARTLARVPAHASADSVDESRLPFFALAMGAMLALALMLLHEPRTGRVRS